MGRSDQRCFLGILRHSGEPSAGWFHRLADGPYNYLVDIQSSIEGFRVGPASTSLGEMGGFEITVAMEHDRRLDFGDRGHRSPRIGMGTFGGG